jgi:hypothetical protein
MRLLSGLVSFSELKNLQNELRCRLEPQTVLLCRRPSVGVEQWIPLERGEVELYPWRFDFIESKGARVSKRKRSSENGRFTSSSEKLGYNSKKEWL